MIAEPLNLWADGLTTKATPTTNPLQFLRHSFPSPTSSLWKWNPNSGLTPGDAVTAMLGAGLVGKVSHAYSGKGARTMRSSVLRLDCPDGIAEPDVDVWCAPMSAHLVLKVPANLSVNAHPLRAEVAMTLIGAVLQWAGDPDYSPGHLTGAI